MHAASREALAQSESHLDELIAGAVDKVAVATTVGTDLFVVVDRLDAERSLRIAVADVSYEPQQRAGIIGQVFEGKVSESSVAVLEEAASKKWSTPREFRTGLVSLGRRALLRAAEAQGQLEQVEEELFRLSRILDREPQLTQLLSDGAAETNQKRGLLANVLYGKVTMITEALALQVIGRPEHNPIDDVANLAENAAQLRERTVARVVSAVELNESQQAALAEKLGQIYGREMSIHSEVDPSLLGGMIIRSGHEVIDGSTQGKLARMRSTLA